MMNKKKKIYISGSGGMLGEAFYHVFSKDYSIKCSDKDVNTEWLDYLDITNSNEYKKIVNDFKPDYLFHLGALTDLEYCELNPTETYNTNTVSVEKATSIANDLDIPLIFISTAGIFDGKKDKYDERDIPKPVSHYAKSKYKAEIFIKNYAHKYYIFRAGWMMGGGIKKDKKFVNKIIKQILNKKNELNIVNDKLGTPTYTFDFAENVKKVITTNLYGLYNLVCKGNTSRYEVCNEILIHFKLKNKIKINLVTSDFFKKEYFAHRPDSEVLVNRELQLISLDLMRDWKICLKEYLNSQYKHVI